MAIDKGSTVLIEAEFKRRTPFGTTLDYYDPTTPELTVTDPVGEAVVDGAALAKSATGKYYYVIQTETTWMPGDYTSTVTATDSGYDEVDVAPALFTLE